MKITEQINDELIESYSDDAMNIEETVGRIPKKTKYILPLLVVGILIFSCVVIGLYFYSLNIGRWIYVHEFESIPPIDSIFHNLTSEDMERFPFLVESIQSNNAVHISEEKYTELWSFLGDNLNIKWNNRYYDIQLRMS